MQDKTIDTRRELVVALCLDYDRRKEVIESGSADRRTDAEFRYYNFNIYDAAAEICGEMYAEVYIYEIGRRIGYAKSRIERYSEVTYKKYKAAIIGNIAKKLHLGD